VERTLKAAQNIIVQAIYTLIQKLQTKHESPAAVDTETFGA
jgi:hypothetical protein